MMMEGKEKEKELLAKHLMALLIASKSSIHPIILCLHPSIPDEFPSIKCIDRFYDPENRYLSF